MSRVENAESPGKIFMGFDVKKKDQKKIWAFSFLHICLRKKKNMDADVFRNMYDDVSKIVDEHGAEAVTMKVLRNRRDESPGTESPGSAECPGKRCPGDSAPGRRNLPGENAECPGSLLSIEGGGILILLSSKNPLLIFYLSHAYLLLISNLSQK